MAEFDPFGFSEEFKASIRNEPKTEPTDDGLSLGEPVAPEVDTGIGFGGHVEDISLGVFNGARQAVLNTVDGLVSLAEGAVQFVAQDESIEFDKDVSRTVRGGEQAFFDTVTFGATEDVKPTDTPDTFGGGLAKGLTQFLVGFVGPSKFIKAAGVGSTIIRGALAGGVADFFAFGAHEERLSNLVNTFPALRNPVTEYLASDEDDSELEGRLKNFVEGGLLGIGAEGAIKLSGMFIKSMKTMKSGIKARNELEQLAPSEATQVLKEAEDLHKGAQDVNVNEAIELEAARIDDEIAKRQVEPEGELNPLAVLARDEELKHLNTQKADLTDVAETLGQTQPKPNLPGINMTPKQLDEFMTAINTGDSDLALELMAKDFNVSGFDTAEAFVSIGNMSKIISEKITVAKGGAKETWKKVDEQVAELLEQGEDASMKVMEDLYGASAELAAKTRMSKMLMQTMHGKVMKMTKGLAARIGSVGETEAADWIRAANNAGEVQSMFMGIRTNIARALNAQKNRTSPAVFVKGNKEQGLAATASFVEKKKIKVSRTGKESAKAGGGSPKARKEMEFETSVARNEDGTIDSITMRSADGKVEVDLSKQFESDLPGAPVNDEDFVFSIIKSGEQKAKSGGPSPLMKDIIRSLKKELPELESLTKAAKPLADETGEKGLQQFEGVLLAANPPKKRPRSAKPKGDLTDAKSGPAVRMTAEQRARSNADLIVAHGGLDRIKKNIKLMSIGESMGVNGRNMRVVYKTKNTKLWMKMFINNILSGPRTFARNFISNTGMLLAHPTKDLLAGVVNDMFIHDVNGATVADALAEFGELFSSIQDSIVLAGRMVAGTTAEAKLTGLVNPLEVGIESFRTGRSQMIPGGNSIFETIADVQAGSNYVHKAFELSGRGLLGADEFFKAINFRMEMKRLARVEARAAGKAHDADFLASLIANPSDDMVDAAFSIAERNTFTQPLGDLGKKFQGLTQVDNSISRTMKMVMPFIRTPVNIMKEVGKSTPLAYKLSSEVRAELLRGGIEAQRAHAQIVLGSAAMVGAIGMVKAGMVTGGGPRGFRSKLDAGRQPYSIVVSDGDGGEIYFQYDRIEPFGVLFGIAADFAEASGDMTEEDILKASAGFITSFIRLTMDRSYLSGMAAFNTMIEDVSHQAPERATATFGKYVTDVAQAFVPFSSALNQAAQAIDPVLRENRTLMDRFMSKIPGLSFSVPPRLNVFAKESKMAYGYGIGLVNPIGVTRGSKDFLLNELADAELDMQMPDRSIGGVDLTPTQYNEYLGLINARTGLGTMHQEMTRVVKSASWKKLPKASTVEGEDSREFKLGRILNRRKRAAANRMKRNHRDLAHSIRLNRLNMLRRRRGVTEIPDPNSRNSIVEALNLY